MRYYKTAIAAGDEKSNVFLGSAYIMANKADEVKPLLPVLEKLAKTNLEALNVVMFYAGRDRKNFDRELVQKVLAGVDARSVLESATPDGMSTVLRLYLATRDMWPVSALAVPARAAALAELWTVALPAYKKILAAEPNNRLGLRGMGLVAFRTGDIMGAANYIMKAYKAGEKAAVSDGIDLFLLSRNRAVWEMFKPLSGEVDPAPAVLAELVRCSVGRDDSADAFYYGALGKNSAPLYARRRREKILLRQAFGGGRKEAPRGKARKKIRWFASAKKRRTTARSTARSCGFRAWTYARRACCWTSAFAKFTSFAGATPNRYSPTPAKNALRFPTIF